MWSFEPPARIFAGLLLLVAAQLALPGCDMASAFTSDEADEDDSKSKKKAKKKSDESEDEDEDDEDEDEDEAKSKRAEKAEPLEVPGITGFVVPAGGIYKRNKLDIGDKVMEFDNYTYSPLSKFPRADLHASFKKHLESAGWLVIKSDLGYDVSKSGVTIEVMFGEAGDDETKINIMGTK